MIENTNNLLENLDIKGILSLLKNEIEKTDQLNAKIQDLKEDSIQIQFKNLFSSNSNLQR